MDGNRDADGGKQDDDYYRPRVHCCKKAWNQKSTAVPGQLLQRT